MLLSQYYFFIAVEDESDCETILFGSELFGISPLSWEVTACFRAAQAKIVKVRAQGPEGPWVIGSKIVCIRFRDQVTLNGTCFLP